MPCAWTIRRRQQRRRSAAGPGYDTLYQWPEMLLDSNPCIRQIRTAGCNPTEFRVQCRRRCSRGVRGGGHERRR
jgi:hypothetical protein